MKSFLALCLALISCVSLAQQLPTGTQTSPNLIYSTVNPYLGTPGTEPYTWSGFTVTESTGGGLSGGNVPGYNVTTGTFMFGYQQGTVAYSYALSTALKNSGMTWLGYNYSWDYINQGYSRGTLSANVNFTATNGTVLHSKNWTLGSTGANWQTVSGTEVFNPGISVANISSFGLSFTGRDDRFWAGYYGPQVRNPSISVLYTFDQCSVNPLSSPECPGYAQAYFNQQCTANPLYNPQCPGYASAYFTQQCNTNGLYNPSCPNYIDAYVKKNILTADTSTSSTTNDTTVSTAPISDTVVNDAMSTTNTTSPTSVTSVTSTNSVIAPVTNAATQSVINSVTTQTTSVSQSAEQKQEQKKTDSAVNSAEQKAGGQTATNEQKKAAVAAAAKEAAEKANTASTMEAQMANQSVVVGLMGYVPGFDAYQTSRVVDINALDMARKYSKPNVDNQNAMRRLGGANELRWSEMVNLQYNIGK